MKTSTEWADEIIKRVRMYGDISVDAESDVQEAFEKAIEEAFRAGFEHAVAGGKEASKRAGIPAENLPLVLYFDNEADREEMIAACALVLPDVVAIAPEK